MYVFIPIGIKCGTESDPLPRAAINSLFSCRPSGISRAGTVKSTKPLIRIWRRKEPHAIRLPFLRVIHTETKKQISTLQFNSSIHGRKSRIIVQTDESVPRVKSILFFGRDKNRFSRCTVQGEPCHKVHVHVVLSQ
ncbi:unknown [Bacteroides fragilis CAG:47]|nr:unknown [Bacteroides fragilis CAG:47]